MYSIHFLNILYHYTCATRAHQWGKRSGTTRRRQFCRWRASISPRFASAINCRSRWGSKHPLNSCNSCKARKSSNPVARSLQPPYSEKEHSTASKILGHVGFLSKLNWSFVGRSSLHLLWLVLYSEETLRLLLKPLLACYDQYQRKK
jgi:hypothetical protein